MDNYSAAVNMSGGGGERRMSGGMGMLLAEQQGQTTTTATTSLGKQPCRAAVSQMDVEEVDDRRGGGGGPMKVARTDAAFGCSELKMYMATATDHYQHHNIGVRNSGSSSGSGSGCLMSEGRLAMSPTNSNASDGIVLTHDGSGSIVSEGGRLISAGAAAARTGLPFQVYHYKPAGGMPMSLSSMGMVPAVRPPFTPSQWQELEHQALIFKFMMAGVQVPPDLLLPIRKSLLSYPSGSHHQPVLSPWASFQLGGYGSNVDPEPGRCRRTDGKKWRCSRDVVPDQKYCERHMHRGRHRGSRKPVEGHTASANTLTSQSHTTCNSSSNTNSTSTSGTGAGSSSALCLAGIPSSNLRPPLSMSSQPQTNQHPNVPRNLSFGGSNNGSQFHQYPLQVSSTPTKDYRYLNGMKGGEMDEQILFSEASGSTGANDQWRSKISTNNSFMNYNSTDTAHVKQEFGLMTEGSQATNFHTNPPQEHHHHHSFLASSGREHQKGGQGQGQPLRHFFDEWPRSRDPWTTHVEDEEERSSRGGGPSSTPSPRGKLSLSPLKLSMSREDDSDDPLNVDPVKMGLAVGMNMKLNVEHRQQQVHQPPTNWMPNAWENPMGMLGPLAEVLQSSTSTPRGNNKKPPGLNLIKDIGWNTKDMDTNRSTSPLRDSHNSSPSCIASSPKGVLQKTLGSISETTNSAGTSSSQNPSV